MEMIRRLSAIAVVMGLIPGAAYAQSFTVRRQEVLPTNMSVQKFATPVAVTAFGVHVPEGAATTPAIRAHIRVAQADPGSPWTVAITDPEGNTERVEHTASKVGPSGFWTDEFASGPLRIALVRGGVALVVDQVATGQVPSIPQAVVGEDQRRPITDPAVPLRVRQRGPGIARLKFMTPDGQAVCSGFLVGRDLLMTNEHCIATDDDARSAVVEFGFDSEASVPHRFHVVKVEASSFGLDYSVLRLSSRPPSQYRRLFLGSSAPTASNRLYIVQHPAGEPKQASFFPDCAAGDLQNLNIPGRETATSDFGHVCDTLGGSSGSPVIDWASGRVVGLHHLGFRPGIDKPQNQAVHVRDILADVKGKVSVAVYNEIVRVQ